MKKITGGITFIAAVAGLISLIYILFDEDVFGNSDKGIIWMAFFLLAIIVIHYTVSSKFWASKLSIIESLNRETEIIKKQIEKRELLAKLENLEKNEKMS